MPIQQNSVRYISALLKKFARKKGFDRQRFIFCGCDDVNGGRKTFFVELYALRSNMDAAAVSFGNHTVEQVFRDAEKQTELQPVSYVLLRAGCYGQNNSQVYAFFPLSALVFDNKEATLSCRTEEPPAWMSLSPNRFSGSILMKEEKQLPYAPEESGAGGFAWNISYTVESSIKKAHGYRRTVCDSWGNKLRVSGHVLYNGRSFSVTEQAEAGFAQRFFGMQSYVPFITLSSTVLENQVSRKQYHNAFFSLSGLADKTAQCCFSYDSHDVVIQMVSRKSKKNVVLNFMPVNNQLHWMCTLHQKQMIFDIDIFAPADSMCVYNYETLDSASLIQVLAGASGSGEIRVYRKHGKDIECLDHLLLKNVFCEHAIYSGD